MRIRLREVRDDELPAFLEALRRFYIVDLERNARLTRVEAEEKATRDHAALLPDDRPLAGHHLLAVEDEHGAVIGRLWFAERPTGAFLYAIDLDEDVRRRGYGREAMQAFEALARERGAAYLSLNVFGGNDIARSLYRSLGYVEESLHMGKRLT